MTQNWQINSGTFPTIYVRILGLGLTSVALALTPLALLTSLLLISYIIVIRTAGRIGKTQTSKHANRLADIQKSQRWRKTRATYGTADGRSWTSSIFKDILLLLNSHECSRKHSNFIAKCTDLSSSLTTVDKYRAVKSAINDRLKIITGPVIKYSMGMMAVFILTNSF